ncbi:hypothetical protein Q5425_36805 [Amycolatopsis sp. A133]|uniref:hypothetical protein n=1 Tax=Amycolatopsis sp. A133 TaxID=3064472 RepID=UPI0027EC4424|nr:hypothetical protein [Amycolatopsis sp. A133]MDQ7809318.1 hypothetical protein [Amycolatopsis sp. A133]
MTLSASSTVWQVRPVDGSRYRVEFCCRGGPAGAFDLLVTPRLRETGPLAGAAGLVLSAVGVLLDRFLPLGVLPPEVDLETLVRADSRVLDELTRRLGRRVAEPQPQ